MSRCSCEQGINANCPTHGSRHRPLRWFLRLVDWLAYLIVGTVALIGVVLAGWGIFYVCSGVFRYLRSREGEGLLAGLCFAASVMCAIKWLEWRHRRRRASR